MQDQETKDPKTEAEADELSLEEKNIRSGKKLLGIIIGSFIFAWASIPLYRIVCQAIDPGGSTWQNGSVDTYEDVEVDKSRTVKVRFASEVNSQLPWEFGPADPSLTVHPGEKKLTKFTAENLDHARAIKGKAVYDINPPEAGQYFKKIECFCFVEQTLEPGEKVDMPLYFWFEPDMPDHIKEITLAYTFFNADSSRSRSTETAQK